MKKKVLYLFLYGLITMVLFFTASHFLSLALHAEPCPVNKCKCDEWMENGCEVACSRLGSSCESSTWRSGRCSIDGSGCNNRYRLKCENGGSRRGVCSVQCPECQIH